MPYLYYIMYLRKSRQDDPRETVEEVLAKHEAQLQEYARKELGGEIPEGNIYREVVSGESIEDRVEIQKVLARIEDPSIKGVLVIEPQRLSRGDLEDCGRLINDLRYTNTLVVTPMMTYDLTKKMERKFFQDELLRGRDFLEYTKEILFRGRVAAVKRGCYISHVPPYGYNRIKIGKDWTLEPNDDADNVRMIFEWHVKEGLTPGAIARRLNGLGYKSPRGKDWGRDTVRDMLTNVHYIGKVRFNETKATWVVENGERIKRHLKQAEEDIIIAEGKQPAIVDPELFEASQTRFTSNPRLKSETELKNPFSSMLRCSKCGRAMHYSSKKGAGSRYVCRNSCFKSCKVVNLDRIIITALEQAELPKLQAKLENGDGNAAAIQKRRLDKLTKQMAEYRTQEDKQYELLETGKYTQELFDRRNAALREKMEECEKEMHMARMAMPKNVDYAEKIVSLEKAIAALKEPTVPTKEVNRLLRAIIDRIDYSAKDAGFDQTDITLEIRLRL